MLHRRLRNVTHGLISSFFDLYLFLTLIVLSFILIIMCHMITNQVSFFFNFNRQDVEMPMSCWLPKGRRWMAEAEIKHGRVAMMACLIFAILELSSKAHSGRDLSVFVVGLGVFGKWCMMNDDHWWMMNDEWWVRKMMNKLQQHFRLPRSIMDTL